MPENPKTYSKVESFLDKFRKNQLAIIVDDCIPEPRGIITMPAEAATTDRVNRLIKLSRGIVHVALTNSRAKRFQLAEMSRSHTEARFYSGDRSRAFVSVEARHGVTTGISAADRAATLLILGRRSIDPRELIQPGHIFPMEARTGGVLVRNTLTDAALDCARLLGATDAAAYADCLAENGYLLNQAELEALALKNEIGITTISDLVRYRLANEPLVSKVAEASLPTTYAGELTAHSFRSRIYSGEHIALVKGDITTPEPVLTRVQAESTFSDVFGAPDSHSRKHLQQSLQLIGERGRGVVVYLRKSSPGCLSKELAGPQKNTFSVASGSQGMMRQYGIGAQILRELGISEVELISSKTGKISGIYDFGINIVSTTALPSE